MAGGISKVISKTNRKIRSTTSAVGNAGLDTVGGVANLAGGAVQGGAGLVGGAAKLGVGAVTGVGGLAANTAQLGAGLAVNTVTSGVGLGMNTVLTGATLAASGAAMGVGALGNGAHTLQGGVLGLAHGISGHGGHRAATMGNINEMDIYCSDLYTVEFVLEEIAKCKKSPVVDTLVIEDLILRDEEKLLKAAINLVYKTTLPPKDEFDLEDDVVLPRTPYERAWKSLTFCECITSAEDYQTYTEKKKEFHDSLRKVLKKRGVSKMPIKFTAKVEIAMLDMNEMIDLLHEIENDKTVISVKFPDVCKDIRKLPSALADRFDEETLDWKDDAEPVEIHLKFGSKPAGKGKDGKKKRPTMLVRQCSLKLEHIVMNSSKCFDDDDDSYFATGSAGSLPFL